MITTVKPSYFHLLLCLTLFFSLITAGWCAAQEQPQPASQPRTGPERSVDNWNTRFSLGYLAAADLRGIGATASLSDLRWHLNRSVRLDDATTLTVGGGYGLKHIDASAGAHLPQDLHELLLEAALKYRISQHSFANLKVSPGLYSDFKRVGIADLKMPLLGLGGYRFDNNLTVVGGFLYRFGYHAAPFLPILGVSYQPVPEWRIDLVMPRPGVTYLPSRQLRLFLAGDFASDEYQLHDSSLQAGALKYRDLKILGGAEYLPLPALKLSAALGYAFDRSFDFYDATRSRLRIDDVPFFKLAVDYGW